MKSLKPQIKLSTFLLALISLSACSMSDAASGGGYYYNGKSYYNPTDDYAPSAKPADSEYAVDPLGGDGSSKDSRPTARPGQLTCSAVNDNNKYDYWLKLNGLKDQDQYNEFDRFRKSFGEYFNTYNRVKLTVKNGNDISVRLIDENMKYYVDNTETAYLFPDLVKEEYDVEISYLDKNGERATYTTTVKDNDVIDLENDFTLSNRLEIMFVVDATGSMGDEMYYIKSEIIDVLSKVKQKNPDTSINLAMMVYRDKNDSYLTKYSDFSTDIEAQQQWFAKQEASGGGDIPEAVQVAMKEAVEKQWSNDSTKLIVHVADAPSHNEDVDDWAKEVYNAANKGIKIITVSGSGVTKQAEYLFRSQSLITGGQYVFLTDDSGIGNGHIEASTDEEPLVVEYLNDCLVRLINGYATGDFREPVSWTQA